MKTPMFAHGTYSKVKEAIEKGILKYPSYVWIDDYDQYSFLNKDGELEKCGVPKLYGSQDAIIILSALDDGIYEVSGVHKITSEHETTFLSSSPDLYVIQTINGKKKIKRITADIITDYVIEEDLSVTEDFIVTESYLKEQGYADEAYIDTKMVALKEELESEIYDYVDRAIEEAIAGQVEPIVEDVVDRQIDEKIQDVNDELIRDLFK